ncbi:MAG: damage-inducible protein DinB [Gemmatimonadetes bacterium]|nr:damage-inducible protein DinB [Gemmatimonadota bacterium]
MSIPLETIRDLYIHMEWADARIWASVLGRKNQPTDPRLHDLRFHFHFTQRAFLQVWTGQKVDRYDPKRFPTLPELCPWARSFHADAGSFLGTLDGSDLDRRVSPPWVRLFEGQLARTAAPTTLGETMLQVAYHTHYHRAQVNTRLREMGAEPPLVDYIAWLWLERPAPEWLPGD